MAFQQYFRRRDQENDSSPTLTQSHSSVSTQPSYQVDIIQFPENTDAATEAQRRPEYRISYNHDGTLPSRVLHLKSAVDTVQHTASDDEGEVDGAATPVDYEKDLEKGDGVALTTAITAGLGSTLNEEELGKERYESSKIPGTIADPNIVDWDGPDDPANPQNWAPKRKWGVIAILGFITFLTPLASTMFAPAVPEVMADFHNDNVQLAGFIVSVYIIGYVFGPLCIAPLSELYGRKILLNVTNVCFLGFMIGCSRSTNIGQFIVFRFLTGFMGSTPLTIGGGMIADLLVQEKRGGAMAIWAMGPILGPIIGPVAGGYAASTIGWRWIFYIISITSFVFTVGAYFLLSETYAPRILALKTKRLIKDTGNPNLRSRFDTGQPASLVFRKAIIRPMKMLVLSPIVAFLSLYMAICYGYLYLLFTTFTVVFESVYHFSPGSAGLAYLGLGVGSMIGLIVSGAVSDRILKRMAAKGEMKPEYRLPPMVPAAILLPIALFMYGWSAEKHVHWIVPIIGTAIFGIGMLASFMSSATYLIDAWPIYAASSTAASTVLRSIFGAILPLAGQSMYDKLGLGWGNSVLGFIALAMLPVPLLLLMFGERIRLRFPLDL